LGGEKKVCGEVLSEALEMPLVLRVREVKIAAHSSLKGHHNKLVAVGQHLVRACGQGEADG